MIYLIPAIVIALDLIVRVILSASTSRSPQPAPQSRDREGAVSYLRILVNAAAFLALIAAAATSLNWQPALTGDRLMWHVTAAPAFALSGIVLVLFWAHRNRFAQADGVRLTSPASWAVPLRKFFFWLAVVLAIPALLAILAAMFPLVGTDDQKELIELHRYCAQLTASAGLLFAYFALVTWRDRSAD